MWFIKEIKSKVLLNLNDMKKLHRASMIRDVVHNNFTIKLEFVPYHQLRVFQLRLYDTSSSLGFSFVCTSFMNDKLVASSLARQKAQMQTLCAVAQRRDKASIGYSTHTIISHSTATLTLPGVSHTVRKILMSWKFNISRGRLQIAQG